MKPFFIERCCLLSLLLVALVFPGAATFAATAASTSTDASPSRAMTKSDSLCSGDGFDDGALDAAWTLDALGDAGALFVEEAGGALELTGTGSELYHGSDNGAFFHGSLDGDFRIEADLTALAFDDGGEYRKGGLMARSSTDPLAARVMATFVPAFPDGAGGTTGALMFDVRQADGGPAAELASTVTGISLPVRLAIQRRGSEVAAYYSTDGGATWIHPLGALGGRADVALGVTASAGFVVASYDSARPLTLAFDDLALCRPDDVAPTLTPLACDAGSGIDLVYLVDLSGSMTRLHGDPATAGSKLASVRSALLGLNSSLDLLGVPVRTALVTYQGTADAQTNLDQGAQILSSFTEDREAIDSLVGGLGYGVNLEAGSPAAIGLAQVMDLLLAERQVGHRVGLVWATDNLPNIDGAGGGPLAYADDELQAITLYDEFGDYLPPGLVAWQGNYNGGLNTYDGEPVADAMDQVIRLRNGHGDLRIFGLVPRGDGVSTPVLREDLLEYASYYTQGDVLGAIDAAALTAQSAEVLTELACGAAGQGVIEGRVWHDVDGDGVQDPGEPGLAGVDVEIFDLDWEFVGAPRTDADGRFSRQVPAGTYRVIAYEFLPSDRDTPTWDRDGEADGGTIVTVGPWQVIDDADFGFWEGGVGPIVGCFDDDFDGSALYPGWTLASLGDADQVSVDAAGDSIELTGDGTTLYAGTDNGAFLYRRLAGHFRAEIDLLGFPSDQGGAYRKAGLVVRSGLGETDPRVMIQYIPHWNGGSRSVLQFRYRATAGGPGDGALGSNIYDVPLPARLAIERLENTWKVEYSIDGGATWIVPAGGSLGTIELDMGSEVLVGPNVVSYDANTALTAEFDDFEVCEVQPPCQQPPAGMLGWWPGDGHSRDLVSGISAARMGNATYAEGFNGQAFSLDGSGDWLRSHNITVPTQFTAEAWIKLQSKPGGWTNGQGVIAQYIPGIHFIFEVWPQAGGIGFWDYHWLHVGKNFTDGWHHVVAVRDASSKRTYVDGELVGTTGVGGASTRTAPISIGYTGDYYRYAKGLIDEVAIYGRALDANEVRELYEAGAEGKCKP